MALVTGVLVRVLHAVFNAHGDSLDWHAIAGRFILIPVILLGMAAVHLAQFPVRQWVWRAPAFAGAEVVVGAVTSLVLIAMERERIGTVRAEFSDWPAMVVGMLAWHLVMICLFAFILGLIVQWVRRREFVAAHQHEHLLTHPPGGTPGEHGAGDDEVETRR
jgi:hypothetical protein